MKDELKLGQMLQLTSLQTDSIDLVSVIQSSYDVRTTACVCTMCIITRTIPHLKYVFLGCFNLQFIVEWSDSLLDEFIVSCMLTDE